jgi:hypothetical protein
MLSSQNEHWTNKKRTPNTQQAYKYKIIRIAEQEREAISERTKEALATVKVRGSKLANPNRAGELRRADNGIYLPCKTFLIVWMYCRS